MVSERTKNPAKQNSLPAAGRFRDIFHFRRSPIIVFYLFIKTPLLLLEKYSKSSRGIYLTCFVTMLTVSQFLLIDQIINGKK